MNYNFKEIPCEKEEILKYLLEEKTLICYLDGITYFVNISSSFPQDIQERMVIEGKWQLVIMGENK